MANGQKSSLPPGFVLDAPVSALPAGFVLDPIEDQANGNIPSTDIPGTVPDGNERSGLEQAIGVGEAGLALVGGALAEPIAGVAGVVQAINPFAEPGAGGRAVEATREAAAGLVAPRTEAGQEALEVVQEAVQPVAETISGTEQFLGNAVFEATGSPTLAAAATTIPAALMEIIGFGVGGKVVRAGKKGPSRPTIKRAVIDAAPEVEAIKNTARGVYQELDDSGAKIKPQAYNNLVARIERVTKKQGLDARVTPRAAGAIEVLKDVLDTSPTLTEIDTLRKVAGNVAKTIDPTESSLGKQIIGEIDDFLDNIKPGELTSSAISAEQIAPKYRAARQLWGRARRSELITDAIDKGSRAASGLENGIRQEFNRIINSKKQSKFFPKEELASMQAVVDGDFTKNMLKHIGKFGISIDRAGTNLMAALGGVGGAATGGIGGAGAVIAIGTAAKQIGKLSAKREAAFVDSVVRAGTNSEAIAQAYLTSFPKSKRTAIDLSTLFLDPQIDISGLLNSANKIKREAAEIAEGRRLLRSKFGAVTAGAAKPEQEQPQ